MRRTGRGRPKIASETRDLIRQTSAASPLWGAPRIHGELLKLGIEVVTPLLGDTCRSGPKSPPLLDAASLLVPVLLRAFQVATVADHVAAPWMQSCQPVVLDEPYRGALRSYEQGQV
jgi:hypothetical protein